VEFASAQLELLNIRAIRAQMLLEVDIEEMNTQKLRRLASLTAMNATRYAVPEISGSMS
jgi:hypothetical protein